jgi:hypothetical protein
MAVCPNSNHPDWKLMVTHLELDGAISVFENNGGEIPFISYNKYGKPSGLFQSLASVYGEKNAVMMMLEVNSPEYIAKHNYEYDKNGDPIVDIDTLSKVREAEEELIEEKKEEDQPVIKFQKSGTATQWLRNELRNTYGANWYGIIKGDLDQNTIDQIQNTILRKLGKGYTLRRAQSGNWYVAGFKNQNIFSDDYTEPNMQRVSNPISALASDNPELQDFIVEQLRELYPDVEIFKTKEAFLEYVNKNFGSMEAWDIDANGAAFANAVFIDPTKARQNTIIHEFTHLYWDALPKDLPIKKRLMEMFPDSENPEEDVIEAIANMGEESLRIKRDGTWMEKFNQFVRIFWSRVKDAFGKGNANDLSRILSDKLLKNKGKFGGKDFVNSMVKWQKYSMDENVYQDEKTHSIYLGDQRLSSPSSILAQVASTEFDRRNYIAIELGKRMKEDNSMTPSEIEATRKQIEYEWELNSKIGKTIHDIAEHLTNNVPIPAEIQRMFLPEALESLVSQLKDYMNVLSENGEYNLTSEELVYSAESMLGGVIDISARSKSGKVKIRDFKAMKKSPWGKDGKLEEVFNHGYGLKKKFMKPPFGNVYDSKRYKYAMQVNLYAKMYEETYGVDNVEDIGITPIVFQADSQGTIVSIKIEKEIPVKRNEEIIGKLIDVANKKNKDIPIAADNVYDFETGFTKQEYYDAVKSITERLPIGVSLRTMTLDQAVDIMWPDMMNIDETLMFLRGFTEAQVNNMTLYTKLYYYQTGKNAPEGASENFNEAVLDKDQYATNMGSEVGPVGVLRYDKALKAHNQVMSEITSIDDLKTMDISKLIHFESILRPHYDNSSKQVMQNIINPLYNYISTIIYQKQLAEQVINENKPGSNEFPMATIIMSRLINNGSMNIDISEVGDMKGLDWFLNSRNVSFNRNREVAYLVSSIRRNQHRTDYVHDDINEDFKKINFRNIDKEKIIYTTNGIRYYHHPGPNFNQDENKFLQALHKYYEKYDRKYQFLIKTNKPANIAVPTTQATWWQIRKEEGWYYTLFRGIGKYTKPSKYDNAIVEWSFNGVDMELVYKDFKDRVRLYVEKGLMTRAEAYEALRDKYEEAERNYKRKTRIGELIEKKGDEKKISVYGSNQSAFYYHENDDLKTVTKQHLKSVVTKYFMEPVIPMAELLLRQTNLDTKAPKLHKWLMQYTERQIYGRKLGEQQTKTGTALQLLMKLSAYKALVWNFKAQTVNLAVGVTQIFTHEGPVVMAKGIKRMLVNRKKSIHLLKRFRIVDVTEDSRNDGFGKMYKGVENFAFALIEFVEAINHGVAFVGMMTEEEFDSYNNKGQLISGKKGISSSRVSEIEFDINAMHGDYGSRNNVYLAYSNWGQMFLQYKRWLPAYITARLGHSYIDQNGKHQRGFYRSVGMWFYVMLRYNNSKTTRQQAYNKAKDYNDVELLSGIRFYVKDAGDRKLTWKDFTDRDRKNIMKAVRELSIVLSMLAVIWQPWDDDEEDEGGVANYINEMATRLFKDSILIFDPVYWKALAKSPIPALGYLYDVIEFMVITGGWIAGADYAKYQRNDYRYGMAGDPKFYNRLQKIIPAGGGIYGVSQLIRAMEHDGYFDESRDTLEGESDITYDDVDYNNIELPDLE